jgi:hypothetical protein
MRRLVPAVALALAVGTTQAGCPFTAAGALIGLISGAASDDPAMDMDDHVRNGAEIGLEIDACLLIAFFESGTTGREARDDGTALALLDRKDAEVKMGPRTKVIVGPTSCVLACRF